MSTLLERWDNSIVYGSQDFTNDEIRRAIAVAQAVDEWYEASDGEGGFLLLRADELLRGEK